MFYRVPELDYKLHEIIYNFHVNFLKLTPPDLNGVIFSGTNKDKQKEMFQELQDLDIAYYQASQKYLFSLEEADLSLTSDIDELKEELEQLTDGSQKAKMEAQIDHTLGMKGVILQYKQQLQSEMERMASQREIVMQEILSIDTRYSKKLMSIKEEDLANETISEDT